MDNYFIYYFLIHILVQRNLKFNIKLISYLKNE
jgi:hypothetical protein